MKLRSKTLFLFIFILVFSNFAPLVGGATNVDNVKLSLLEGKERMKDGKKVMVAGIYHSLEFDSDQCDIELYRGNVSYDWSYDDGWQGDLDYLNQSRSEKYTGHYRVVIGIEGNEPTGIWNLSINGQEQEIVVENPEKKISMQSADFQFQFTPFESETKNSGSQTFILNNKGNALIDYNVNFGPYGSYIDPSNSGGTLNPGNQVESDIAFTSNEWEPGHFTVSGSVNVEPLHIVSDATLQFIPRFSFDLPIDVSVGHEDYEITPVRDDLTIQYKDEFQIEDGEEKDLKFYISGNASCEVDVGGEDIDIKSLEGEGKDSTSFDIDVSEGEEYVFTLTLEPDIVNGTGKVVYTLTDFSDSYRYNTTVEVSGEKETESSESSAGFLSRWGNLIPIIGGVVILILYFYWARFRREKA